MEQQLIGDGQIYKLIYLCTRTSYEECILTGQIKFLENTKSTCSLFHW